MSGCAVSTCREFKEIRRKADPGITHRWYEMVGFEWIWSGASRNIKGYYRLYFKIFQYISIYFNWHAPDSKLLHGYPPYESMTCFVVSSVNIPGQNGLNLKYPKIGSKVFKSHQKCQNFNGTSNLFPLLPWNFLVEHLWGSCWGIRGTVDHGTNQNGGSTHLTFSIKYGIS